MTHNVNVEFSVCICTRNRANELRAAIQSVQRSDYSLHQLIVSDDSTNPETRDLLCHEFPWVHFVEGPRRGLSSNRNNALRCVTGTHVLFIDDDVVLAPNFLASMATRIRDESIDPGRLVLTGCELNRGQQVVAPKLTFLGFMALEYTAHDTISSIVINSTVFPSGLFKALKFDENLIYGYEEFDIASRAVLLHGYRIVHVPEAVNEHYPSQINRGYYAKFMEASRIYVIFKRYYWMEKRPLKAISFLLLAYSHNLLHNLKVGGVHGLVSFGATLQLSANYIRNCFLHTHKFV